jgi:hypothetical protein
MWRKNTTPLLKFAEGSQMRIYYEFENTNVKVSCNIIHISNHFAHHSARIQLFLYSWSCYPFVEGCRGDQEEQELKLVLIDFCTNFSYEDMSRSAPSSTPYAPKSGGWGTRVDYGGCCKRRCRPSGVPPSTQDDWWLFFLVPSHNVGSRSNSMYIISPHI